jgi:hypothetical protein
MSKSIARCHIFISTLSEAGTRQESQTSTTNATSKPSTEDNQGFIKSFKKEYFIILLPFLLLFSTIHLTS